MNKAISQTVNKQLVSRSYAIKYSDYLIASLCIGNGLRASNIIALNVSDVTEAQVDEKYPGHKIITNIEYKTSSFERQKIKTC